MLNQAKSSISDAQAEANYHIGAMQSRYDTFKEEAQYLVAAQKIRVIELEDKISQCIELILKIEKNKVKFDKVELGAFFCVRNHEKNIDKYFFITPEGIGLIQDDYGRTIACINITAPIAKSYIGLTVNDSPDDELDEEIIFIE